MRRLLGKLGLSALAISAALLSAPASALTVSITGVTCTGATATVVGDTVTINCGGGSATPFAGNFALSAATSLPQSTANIADKVAITRSGTVNWTTGSIDIPFTVSGNCLAITASPVSFAPNDTNKFITITTDAPATPPGNCTVTIDNPVGGGAKGAPSSANIAIVNPDANVSFAFAQGTSATNVGAASTMITVQRSGGTNGAWTVNYTLGGSLTTGGTLPAAGGTVSGTLSFPANQSTATITYTPPAALPSCGGTCTLVLNLLGATPVAPLVTGQSEVVGTGLKTHTLTLAGGSSTPSNAVEFAIDNRQFGQWIRLAVPTGSVGYSRLPDVQSQISPTGTGQAVAGVILLGAITETPVSPMFLEATISKTIGEINPNAGACYWTIRDFRPDATRWDFITAPYYKATAGRGQVIDIHDAATAAAFSTPMCWAPKNEGPWYINVRWSPNVCPNPWNAPCAWSFQWNLGQF